MVTRFPLYYTDSFGPIDPEKTSDHSKMYVFILFNFLTVSTRAFVKINPSECTDKNYFDISHLSCNPCEENNKPTADRLSCGCLTGWKKVTDKGGFSVTCEKCPGNQIASGDGWSCITCESNCDTCGQNEILNVRNTLGASEQTVKCASCTGNTKPDVHGDHCVPCNPSIQGAGCICRPPNVTSGGLCFDSKEISEIPDAPSLYTVTFQGGARQESWYFKEHLRAAVTMCKIYHNMTACQLVGNLCVLLFYNRDANQRGGDGACDFYYKLASVSGQQLEWPPFMPQLFYLNSEPNAILHKLDLDARYSFSASSPTNQLQVVMAAYTLNGTFKGFIPTTGGLLQLCKNEEQILDSAYRFGRRFVQKCEINVKGLWNDHELVFYDVYLQYPNNANEKTLQLYPMPVINLNVESNGVLVNTDDQSGRWILTRRIFIVDNVSGKDNANSSAKIVRYAEYIEINVELQTTKDGRIFPPFLKIKYNEVKLDKYDQNSNVMVVFEMSYFMSTVRHEKDIEITMGTLCSMAVLWAAVKTWSWSRRSGKAAVDFVTILKGIIFLGVSIANVFLVVLISMSLWILVLYKRQITPIIMMPTGDQEYSFTVYLGLATAIKIIEMIHLIIVQVTTYVFFIDWERPRGFIIPKHGEPSATEQTKTPSPVTIWRTYFVANEWNELQNYRKTSYVFQLFTMLFFLKVLNFEALALIEPGSTMKNVPREYVDSRMSRFAVASSLYLAIGFFQWFVNVFIVERCIADHFRNFIDLCSISNVSVLVLLHRQFGYYIHGRSIHGHADTDMREMNEMLQRERDNLCSQRGLEPNTEQQSFIACFPHKFRIQFDRVLSPLRTANRTETRLTGADQSTVRTAAVIDVYEQMNQYLTSFIDHVAVEADYMVKDRTMLESVFDMEFQDTNLKGVFYKDPSDSSFSRALPYGNEYTQLTFDLLIFCIIDLIAHSFVIAVVVSFVIFTMLNMFRKMGVRKNLTRTSLVDERFLI